MHGAITMELENGEDLTAPAFVWLTALLSLLPKEQYAELYKMVEIQKNDTEARARIAPKIKLHHVLPCDKGAYS